MWPFRRKPPAPTPEQIAKLSGMLTDYSLTPDYRRLDQSEHQLLFVYCDLQKGMRRHSLIEGHCKFFQPFEAYTAKKNFQMFVRRMGQLSYPIAMRARTDYDALSGFTQSLYEPGTVEGELYVVRAQQLIELDKLKLNGYIYDRVRIHVRIQYSSVFTREDASVGPSRERMIVQEAWMYIGRHDYWDAFIDGGIYFNPGRTKVHEDPMIGRHYVFDDEDLNDKRVPYPRIK